MQGQESNTVHREALLSAIEKVLNRYSSINCMLGLKPHFCETEVKAFIKNAAHFRHLALWVWPLKLRNWPFECRDVLLSKLSFPKVFIL